ncbi:type II toxin-antitoxin system Phd/YefM family antitoxin [bacterium]|nr:type II toxin-antitoxin system Phd/YefM family antitoxin [bacterium]MBU1957719.1 type II toxin-antitoxin system Phd/YefM family antitoxin [bacterium]
MVTYASNELISSSEFAKKFGSYLAQIKSNTVDKLAILKNNHVEAVLISKDDYENMKKLADLQKQSIYNEEIAKRVNEYKSNKSETVPFSSGLDEIREKILSK